ncbi:copper resistance CopC family protein [Dactylosporangium sp. NPDC005555]|uniref:copper resistance CopC family protein n=1 Tax=Dactylosporangium sp. NPDC005555 TaxID=3154889 RepID=UPI0033A82DA3
MRSDTRTRRRIRWRAGAALTLAGVVTALATTASPAWAHNALLSSTPADGAALPTGPPAITMTFREAPNAAMAQVVVVDAAGADLVAGAPTGAGTTLTQPLRTATAAGAVSVTYRVVSADGHPVQGRITFTVTTVPAASPAAGGPSPSPAQARTSATAPAPTTAAATSPGGATSPAAAAEEEPVQPWGVAFVAGLLVGLIAIAAALAFWPRRRYCDPPGDPAVAGARRAGRTADRRPE